MIPRLLRTMFAPLLWLAPFVCFLAGYAVLDLFLKRSSSTPNVLGRPLAEALKTVSAEQLNARLLSYKEDEQTPEGTVLSQTPAPNSSIRPQQTVFLVVSCKPASQKIPACVGKSYTTVAAELKELQIRTKVYQVRSNHPQGTCIAQIPDAGQELSPTPLILYVSQELNLSAPSLVLLPSLTGRPVTEVVPFLTDQKIPFSLFHSGSVVPDHTCTTCFVSEQKPLAGSFIDCHNPPTIQLKINR